MASYAEVAASGAAQSPEEVSLSPITPRANPVPEVIPTDKSIESLIDVDTGVAVVPNDYREQEVKTETQAARIQEEEEIRAASQQRGEQQKAVHTRKEKERAEARRVIGSYNFGIVSLASAAAAFFAYRRQHAGHHLSWKFIGLLSAGITAFGFAEYRLSLWLYDREQAKKDA